MILSTREERVKLLKSGFTGKQIEKLFLILNSFEIVDVEWQGTSLPSPSSPICAACAACAAEAMA